MGHIEHKGWFSRGYLPHFDAAQTYQMITYRLADSLPQHLLFKLKEKLEAGDIQEQEYRSKIEVWLDHGIGSCALCKPHIAELVIDAWMFFDKERYDLLNWVVMPNHVHVLIRQYEQFSLSRVIQSWKSFTANAANKSLRKVGVFWAQEYWDRFIRDEQHYINAFSYIDENPVKVGLVTCADEWDYSMVGRLTCGQDVRGPRNA